LKNQLRTKKSALCVLAAGMLWGCMGILVRTMNGGGFDSLEITAFRALVTAIVMFAGMALFKRKELKVKWKDLWCFAGTGILSVAFFNVCYFTCMNHATLSVAAILLYTAPSFVIIFSFFLFKEKIGRRKLLALALAFVGCVLVSGGLGGVSISVIGLLTGLGAGLGYALYSIFGKFAIQRGYSSYTITTYTFLFALVGTVPLLDLKHFTACIASADAKALLFDVALTFLTTVAAYLFYTAGLRGMENGRASIIASIEPVMASLVGFFLYKEAFTVTGLLGMFLVLASCILVA
jgi:drug/metabolite transporter (DMT)-like permease